MSTSAVSSPGSTRSARSAASTGPSGEWGNARLALTDADRAGRDLVVGWMRDLGHGGRDRRHRQRRRDPARQRSRHLAPVMTGSHIDTVGTGGRFDGNLGVLAGLEVVEMLEQHGITTPTAARRWRSSPTRRARGSLPTCSAASCTSAGSPLEEALDLVAADDGARLGDELARIGYAGTGAVPDCRGAARVRRAAHRAGSDPRGRGRHDRRRRGRAGHLVDRGRRSSGSPPTPAPPRCGSATIPAYCAGAITTYVRDLTRHLGGDQVATVGRIDLHPEPGERRAVPSGHDRRPAQHRRARAASRPRPASATFLEELAASEGVEITTRSLARFEPVEFDAGDGRHSSSDPRRGSGTRPGACRAAPATTPRCSRGSVRRRWSSPRA